MVRCVRVCADYVYCNNSAYKQVNTAKPNICYMYVIRTHRRISTDYKQLYSLSYCGAATMHGVFAVHRSNKAQQDAVTSRRE